MDKSKLTADDKDVIVNVWMSTWERGYAHRPLQLANKDYKVKKVLVTLLLCVL